jgi:hypothetical protein
VPCYAASPQLARHRECRSYGATSGERFRDAWSCLWQASDPRDLPPSGWFASHQTRPQSQAQVAPLPEKSTRREQPRYSLVRWLIARNRAWITPLEVS